MWCEGSNFIKQSTVCVLTKRSTILCIDLQNWERNFISLNLKSHVYSHKDKKNPDESGGTGTDALLWHHCDPVLNDQGISQNVDPLWLWIPVFQVGNGLITLYDKLNVVFTAQRACHAENWICESIWCSHLTLIKYGLHQSWNNVMIKETYRLLMPSLLTHWPLISSDDVITVTS